MSIFSSIREHTALDLNAVPALSICVNSICSRLKATALGRLLLTRPRICRPLSTHFCNPDAELVNIDSLQKGTNLVIHISAEVPSGRKISVTESEIQIYATADSDETAAHDNAEMKRLQSAGDSSSQQIWPPIEHSISLLRDEFGSLSATLRDQHIQEFHFYTVGILRANFEPMLLWLSNVRKEQCRRVTELEKQLVPCMKDDVKELLPDLIRPEDEKDLPAAGHLTCLTPTCLTPVTTDKSLILSVSSPSSSPSLNASFISELPVEPITRSSNTCSKNAADWMTESGTKWQHDTFCEMFSFESQDIKEQQQLTTGEHEEKVTTVPPTFHSLPLSPDNCRKSAADWTAESLTKWQHDKFFEIYSMESQDIKQHEPITAREHQEMRTTPPPTFHSLPLSANTCRKNAADQTSESLKKWQHDKFFEICSMESQDIKQHLQLTAGGHWEKGTTLPPTFNSLPLSLNTCSKNAANQTSQSSTTLPPTFHGLPWRMAKKVHRKIPLDKVAGWKHCDPRPNEFPFSPFIHTPLDLPFVVFDYSVAASGHTDRARNRNSVALNRKYPKNTYQYLVKSRKVQPPVRARMKSVVVVPLQRSRGKLSSGSNCRETGTVLQQSEVLPVRNDVNNNVLSFTAVHRSCAANPGTVLAQNSVDKCAESKTGSSNLSDSGKDMANPELTVCSNGFSNADVATAEKLDPDEAMGFETTLLKKPGDMQQIWPSVRLFKHALSLLDDEVRPLQVATFTNEDIVKSSKLPTATTELKTEGIDESQTSPDYRTDHVLHSVFSLPESKSDSTVRSQGDANESVVRKTDFTVPMVVCDAAGTVNDTQIDPANSEALADLDVITVTDAVASRSPPRAKLSSGEDSDYFVDLRFDEVEVEVSSDDLKLAEPADISPMSESAAKPASCDQEAAAIAKCAIDVESQHKHGQICNEFQQEFSTAVPLIDLERASNMAGIVDDATHLPPCKSGNETDISATVPFILVEIQSDTTGGTNSATHLLPQVRVEAVEHGHCGKPLDVNTLPREDYHEMIAESNGVAVTVDAFRPPCPGSTSQCTSSPDNITDSSLEEGELDERSRVDDHLGSNRRGSTEERSAVSATVDKLLYKIYQQASKGYRKFAKLDEKLASMLKSGGDKEVADIESLLKSATHCFNNLKKKSKNRLKMNLEHSSINASGTSTPFVTVSDHAGSTGDALNVPDKKRKRSRDCSKTRSHRSRKRSRDEKRNDAYSEEGECSTSTGSVMSETTSAILEKPRKSCHHGQYSNHRYTHNSERHY